MEAVRLSAEKLALMKQGGVWVPSPLALGPDKKTLPDWQRLLTLYYIRSGARAVIPGAHTGEFAANDLGIYSRWVALVKEMIEQYGQGRMFLMAAVGGPNALRMAELAAGSGFDIVMVAPTAFRDLDDDGVVKMMRDIAGIIPVFGFELVRSLPGSRDYNLKLWRRIFEFAYGAKGASFDTYRSQVMLEAAALSERRDELVMATGNDDRIVHDLGTIFPFRVNNELVKVKYHAGLLGHFATDTHAAVLWSEHVRKARDGAPWTLPVPERELAHLVNMCNGALFDARNNFQNSVWGVKRRLTDLGLLPAPFCLHECGRAEMSSEIAHAYSAHAVLNDESFLSEHLAEMKREVGLPA